MLAGIVRPPRVLRCFDQYQAKLWTTVSSAPLSADVVNEVAS